ncbi:MAG: hypothetical protein A3F17_00445 [Gammaproteobacteria bacterium RIFCSPHIGHO2_12_FULL_41_15]|nr:MAG: hypothetical protein A3F17_00445 [Gammaproteobacteria bacterium RIFCSPHIGHO2_12_FULL_41_15]
MKKAFIPTWVHALADYSTMFDLTESDLQRRILDYPAGISSFNAEMVAQGHKQVVSADQYYGLSPLDMVKHVDGVIQELSEKIDQYREHLHEVGEKTQENLLNVWNQYAQRFLADYSIGQQEGRYCVAFLPHLPFADNSFELALCPDLIFREPSFSREQVVLELCRVAHEVRVFPLLSQTGEIASELGPMMLSLQQLNLGVEVKHVPYALLKKSNAMLRIWNRECVVAA